MTQARSTVHCVFPISLVEELERGIAVLDGTPGRRMAIGVTVALVGPKGMEKHIFGTL